MKTLLFASIIFLLFSCQKEISYEPKTCGIVVDKRGGLEIDVDFSGVVIRVHVGLIPFSQINIGDKYCK